MKANSISNDPGTPTVYDPQTAILNEAVYEEPEPIALDYVLNLPHSPPIDDSWRGGLSPVFSKSRVDPTSVQFLQEPELIGRRKALLVGINYISMPPKCQLDKAHTDVDSVHLFLQELYGYAKDRIRILKDDGGHPDDQPTLDNIRYEMTELVRDAAPGDHLFFYYAGHGRQVKDLDGDEEDGFDEVIVSSDIKNLIDDEIHSLMVRPLPKGCRLTALVDCCKSGTILDLPFILSVDSNPAPSSRKRPNGRPIVRKHSNGDVILISACEDSATAYEVVSKRKGSGGALTREFIGILRHDRFITHYGLLNALHARVDSVQRPQKPQLSSSKEIDIHAQFHI
ncbi:hypothetical protein SCHPADRAFT_936881 [Schizopora paradoxa]|uniref:Peptidase C14 caspase domain-containing protein n=1 Tax=Schizopora paradoxa TaxID=27342 RepID=A0A0H2S022_9AGAM|nr:hypothetical protein SCHPADRAFT_936881 [Schizopora paradoxa]